MQKQSYLESTSIIDEFGSFLERLYEEQCLYTFGEVSSSIPELEYANPERFGICVVDVNGESYSTGDAGTPFTLQSAAKPFVYGSTIEQLSDTECEKLIAKIGFEPTGTPFNTIIQQDDIQKGVLNPMLNAGAIVTAGAIQGDSLEERWLNLSQMIEKFAGRKLEINASALESKWQFDHRNIALAHLMVSEGLLEGSIDEAIELYFRQCSIEATCKDLAVMAATLARSGVNPITQTQVVKPKIARNLLSVMYTCGMYDFSGQWAYRVGLPAKCGISGAVLMVVPKVCGLAVYSPLLGDKLISNRGIRVCEAFSKHFGLHIFSEPYKKSIHSLSMMDEYPTVSTIPTTTYTRNVEDTGKASFDFNRLSPVLETQYHRFKDFHEGMCYQSEHGIADVDPRWFGICAVSVDGDTFRIGDHDRSFLIQSISKIFTYGLALEDYGRDYLSTKVDVEPTGKSYDSIIKVQKRSKRPHNPMVNTGAIAVTSLIQGGTPAKRLNRILEMYRRYGGRDFHIDMPTYISEQNGGYRNWAIAYLLRNFEMIEGDILQTLDLYLQQCSVVLNCHDLATMGATLANYGVNPFTQERALKPDYVQDILSVMFTCGMYDFTGEWVYKIGFPAKSGVSGAIVIVIPGVCGITVYSPPLDWRGNSVRGVKVGECLFRELDLHIFDPH